MMITLPNTSSRMFLQEKKYDIKEIYKTIGIEIIDKKNKHYERLLNMIENNTWINPFEEIMKAYQPKVKKLNSKAIIPTKGTMHSAGFDLYACLDEEIEISPNTTVKIPTGIAIQLLEGTFGGIYARSGLATKQGLAPSNKVGIVDSDYRGEVIVALHNHSGENRTVKHGDRVAQLIIQKYETTELLEVDELEDTKRGNGGFGSTGK